MSGFEGMTHDDLISLAHEQAGGGVKLTDTPAFREVKRRALQADTDHAQKVSDAALPALCADYNLRTVLAETRDTHTDAPVSSSVDVLTRERAKAELVKLGLITDSLSIFGSGGYRQAFRTAAGRQALSDLGPPTP